MLCTFFTISQLWSHFYKNDFNFFNTINGLIKIAPKKFRKLPSAARFCTKRFRHIDFWTFFLSISWKFFRVLNIEKKHIFIIFTIFKI
jgi:hypothetical protein